jgi:polyribonucleotide nucleotidyltransferase
MENDPDIVSMVAASAALTLSGLPFLGPIGAARVGLVNNELVLNPLMDEMPNSALDLVVAGTADAVMMVESEAQELSEQRMLEAVMFGQHGLQPVIDAIIRLAEKAAKEPWAFQPPDTADLKARMMELIGAELSAAFQTPEKQKRHELVDAAKKKAFEALVPADATPDQLVLAASVFKALGRMSSAATSFAPAAASTDATSSRFVRSPRRCRCSRARTARHSSLVGRRRPSLWRRLARAMTSR